MYIYIKALMLVRTQSVFLAAVGSASLIEAMNLQSLLQIWAAKPSVLLRWPTPQSLNPIGQEFQLPN